MAFDRDKTLQLAQKYIEKRKYDRAIGEYQKVVQHDPNDARTLLRIGDLQSRQQSFAEAISSYDRVARFYAGRGFSLKAIAVLKQIREMIDTHAPHLADQYSHVAPKLAQIYADLGLTTDALATYEGAVRRLQSAGRERDVVDILRRMLTLDPSNPLPYLRLAEALCRLGRLDEAIEHFWSAAQQLTQLNRAEDALKVIERILHFRQDVRVCRVAAELYLARGTREAALLALSRLQACFDADPKDLETLLLLAQAFELLEQSSKSLEVYKEMVRLAGDSGQDELRDTYLAHLQQVAPGDSGVQALAEAARTGVPSAPPVGAAPGVSSLPSFDDEDSEVESGPESLPLDAIEFLDDDDAIESLDPEEPETAVTPSLSERAKRVPLGLPPSKREGNASRVSAPSVSASSVSAPSGSAPSVNENDPEEIARQALVDAEAFRGLGLYDKALRSLREALNQGHDSVQLRSTLRRVLEDRGDVAGAIEQMMATAQLHEVAGARLAALAELRRLLAISPGHTDALRLFQQWGGEAESRGPVSEAVDSSMNQTGEHEAFELRPRVVPSEAPISSGRAPLPSYTLEYDELEVEEVQSVVPLSIAEEAAVVEATVSDAAVLDAEPSALSEVPESDMSDAVTQVPPPRSARVVPPRLIVAADPPLPQFTLEELHVSPSPPSVVDGGLPSESVAPVSLSRQSGGLLIAPISVRSGAPPSRGVLPAPAVEEVPPGSPPPSRDAASLEPQSLAPQADGAARRESIRAALDEVEFFSSRGLYQDATMILKERLEQYPGEPGLIEALASLDKHLQMQQSAVASRISVPAPIPSLPAGVLEEPAPLSLRARFTTDGTVEAGPVLDVENEMDIVASLEQVPATEIDIDEVFAKFKQGVKDQIEESDSATHYDLGVAYKEMGLLADAGQEFEIASRDPKRECNSLGMMGMMYRESGDLERSIEAYVRALNAGQKSATQEVSLYYELGCIYQEKQDAEEATYYFQRIVRRQEKYRDVVRRIAQLKDLLPSPSRPPAALNRE